MGSKQSGSLFLKEFTSELVYNSRSKEVKILMPDHPVKNYSQFENPAQKQFQNAPVQQTIVPMTRELIQQHQQFQSPQGIRPSPMMLNHPVVPTHMQNIQRPIGPQSPVASITPVPQPLPPGFTLGKLDSILLDTRITNIECPGPGKYVIVKMIGKTTPTKMMLSEEEIKKVIDSFSQQAKIPLMEGIFKAAVGNLIITAVISDFVGSRFIINKYTPYSILERQNI